MPGYETYLIVLILFASGVTAQLTQEPLLLPLALNSTGLAAAGKMLRQLYLSLYWQQSNILPALFFFVALSLRRFCCCRRSKGLRMHRTVLHSKRIYLEQHSARACGNETGTTPRNDFQLCAELLAVECSLESRKQWTTTQVRTWRPTPAWLSWSYVTARLRWALPTGFPATRRAGSYPAFSRPGSGCAAGSAQLFQCGTAE